MTILDTILKEKAKEIEALKKTEFPQSTRRTSRSLFHAFQKSKTLQVIAEIKRASPSKGDIRPDVNPLEQAKAYVDAGAGAISVLTDTPFFKGSMEDLASVREAVDVPILCKDFIVDTVQIDRARAYGADVILLIAAALPKDKLQQLYDYATLAGLEVLLEVHNEAELADALAVGATIIGINNRDLKTFQVSFEVTEKLAEKLNVKEKLLISESGFRTKADAERAAGIGAKGILVGETLMEAEDIYDVIQSFSVPLGERV